ncbi:DUF456 domain-containing protein [Streptomyces cocklensis]|jgi:uncharacterized protein YqgC (DUF456 family)|uniref:DUF456 domain-containing protein n=1 Tax=Actinacidiphila cocklensis TaxID=887465 RepID=A0A9W4DVB6_9ACTN|nr:DUF456 domain-containing protein [Actinacidiphila cocklensis]MDD1059375.1 DUF456 domain-containing protein [Actinacidiphila cocklensis]WSX76174.1 DUF456 domain-containing protein [Streptomyces sp. NBC_00899]CAG6396705.1 conserved membrane hypothetical protein [Actinacidiphila cocklensis]
MGTAQACLIGAVMLLGLVGVAVPGVPGTLLCWAAVLWWATSEHTSLTWGVLAGATGLLAVAQVVVWRLPTRRIRDSGVTWRTMVDATAVAIVGFVLIPVLGAVLGFVGSIYVTERVRLGGGHRTAWTATRRAMRTVGCSVLVELLACLLVAGTWLIATVAA